MYYSSKEKKIDWESLAKDFLWKNVVHDKNGYSGYDAMVDGGDDVIVGPFHFSSMITPDGYKPLTWKELALALGLFEDQLTSDGHRCKECPVHDSCYAFFKDDEDHERCYWWGKNMVKNKEK